MPLERVVGPGEVGIGGLDPLVGLLEVALAVGDIGGAILGQSRRALVAVQGLHPVAALAGTVSGVPRAPDTHLPPSS